MAAAASGFSAQQCCWRKAFTLPMGKLKAKEGGSLPRTSAEQGLGPGALTPLQDSSCRSQLSFTNVWRAAQPPGTAGRPRTLAGSAAGQVGEFSEFSWRKGCKVDQAQLSTQASRRMD